MKKLIRDGKVGVLISEGYGAGWSTWNTEHGEEMLFSPEIIELVEQNAPSEAISAKARELWDGYVCLLGVEGLTVKWIPQGTMFFVAEYDGAESIITEFLES